MERTMSDKPLNAEDFKNPNSDWRGKPFWCWNGVLEKDELIRQVHILKEMGMGGYFMHSRTGLATEYLGEEWFELTNACAEEGARLGMESWLYDEDRWPSGPAGGMVTANPEYRMKLIMPIGQVRNPDHLAPGAVGLRMISISLMLNQFVKILCRLSFQGKIYLHSE